MAGRLLGFARALRSSVPAAPRNGLILPISEATLGVGAEATWLGGWAHSGDGPRSLLLHSLCLQLQLLDLQDGLGG